MKNKEWSSYVGYNQLMTKIIEGKVLNKRGQGRSLQPYFEVNKHRMQIGRLCDKNGVNLDRREWSW